MRYGKKCREERERPAKEEKRKEYTGGAKRERREEKGNEK